MAIVGLLLAVVCQSRNTKVQIRFFVLLVFRVVWSCYHVCFLPLSLVLIEVKFYQVVVLAFHSDWIHPLGEVESNNHILNTSCGNHMQLMVCASAPYRIIDFLEVQTFFLFIIKDLNRPLMRTLSREANRVRPKLWGSIICLTKRVLTLDNNVRIAWIPWIARKILLQSGWLTFDFFQKGLWQSKVDQIFEHQALALFLVNILHAPEELNFDFLKCLLW